MSRSEIPIQDKAAKKRNSRKSQFIDRAFHLRLLRIRVGERLPDLRKASQAFFRREHEELVCTRGDSRYLWGGRRLLGFLHRTPASAGDGSLCSHLSMCRTYRCVLSRGSSSVAFRLFQAGKKTAREPSWFAGTVSQPTVEVFLSIHTWLSLSPLDIISVS